MSRVWISTNPAYYEQNAESDQYLRRLIEACHRNAIQVYAWLELPHVSERFWAEHPEWRDTILNLGAISVAREQSVCFLAEFDGEPGAAAGRHPRQFERGYSSG